MSKITKSEKKLREGLNKWKSFLNEGAFKSQVQEARMGEYGKIDAEDGNPPTKIGRGNEEYMAAYNAVLQARGEQPLDIQKPDQAYLDALQQGRMKPSDHSYNLEENITDVKVGDKVNIIGGAVVGAYGEVIELTTTGGIGIEGGLPAIVVRLTKSADKPLYGGKGDEVIVQPKFVEKLRMGDSDVMYGSDDEYDDLEEGASKAEFKVGDEVIANGHNGTITDLSIPGMATVALKRGEVSVPLNLSLIHI